MQRGQSQRREVEERCAAVVQAAAQVFRRCYARGSAPTFRYAQRACCRQQSDKMRVTARAHAVYDARGAR